MKKAILAKYRDSVVKDNFSEDCGVFRKDKTNLCTVTWIENEWEFFVQKLDDVERIDHVNSVLDRYFPDPELWVREVDPQPGYIVAALWKNGFYRAEVLHLNLIALNTYEACVRLLDYGHVVSVPFHFLRNLPEVLNRIPKLAIPCQLFDCLPINSEEFKVAFSDLVYDKKVYLEVMSCSSESLKVDLVMDIRGRPTSVREALIFCGLATFAVEQTTCIPNIDFRSFPSPTTDDSQLLPGSSHLVIMSNIRPSSEGPIIHIQFLSSEFTLQLPALMSDMRVFYRARKKLEMWGVKYMPEPGTPCAVSHREYGKEIFYRGQVLRHVGGLMLEVVFVDFGNIELVSRYKIFRLFDDFLELPALAFPVHLKGSENIAETACFKALRDKIGLNDLVMNILEIDEDRCSVDLSVNGHSVLEHLSV